MLRTIDNCAKFQQVPKMGMEEITCTKCVQTESVDISFVKIDDDYYYLL